MTTNRCRRNRRGGLAAALSACALLLGAAPLQASDAISITIGGASGKGSGWEESLGLQPVRDDAVDADARIFDSPDYQRHLLVPGEKEDAFVLSLRDRTVHRLPWSALTWTPAELPVPDLSASREAGAFTALEGVIEFADGDAHWSIRPQPALVGPVAFETLKKEKPEYLHAAAKYAPDAGEVRALHAVQGDTKILVFFGTWCAICKHELPRLLRTIEEAKNPRIALEFVGVTEDHDQPADLLKRYSVDATPTFLVLQGGKEIGRITEEPDDSVEADLAAILAGR